VCALEGCDVDFLPRRDMERCCSERHGKMHYNRVSRADGRQANPPWDARRRANWKKRYALTRGAEDAESFDYFEVFERDGWVCGICEGDVDPDCAWPDPMSPSLDHVAPVAHGGAHSRENAQLAHLLCNIRKSDSLEIARPLSLIA
jgi:5-methylcytosine-specific restriction endonuclease McrA